MPFLKSLNPIQAEAVTFGDGPLLILAGAGSGKTKVLTARIAYLVLKKGVPPENVLAVTFTNKAAGEMRKRLFSLIGDRAQRLWLGTFHSIGVKLLRREARSAGIGHDLTIYDDDDQLSLIKQVLGDLSINEKTLSPKAVLARINQAKNENIGASEFAGHARDFISERVARVYSLYQKKLREYGAMDFGDLICEPVKLLRHNPHILKGYQDLFQYLLVDEYQDTNRAQYELTNLLASGTRNLLAVGDPDQSIYAWRGADIGNILDFGKDYPDSTTLRLEQNYRSTKNILSAANAVIVRNRARLEKTLWTENPAGDTLIYEEARDEYDEARRVIKGLKGLLDGDRSCSYRDCAVFYRTNAQSRVFEEQLMREGIPYTIVGGVRFYDRKEIKDAVAYLRVIANPNDTLSLQRVINNPPRGVGKATLDRVLALSAERGVSLFQAFGGAIESGALNKTRVREFLDACEGFRRDLGRLSLHELTLRLLEDSGYMLMWQEDGSEEAMERVENIFELISAIKDFESVNNDASLSGFLDQVALISDMDTYDDAPDRVTLMTLHSAKGLEFRAVFMAGMEEGLFPHSRSKDDPESLEEERRLCYVGMTRARERLRLYSAKTRTVYGETRCQMRSRFIDEIPPELLTMTSAEPPARKLVYTDEPYYTSEDSQASPGPDHTDGQSGPLAWKVGAMVMHPSFGQGIIKERSGQGPDAKLTVNFKDYGVKKLVVKYASLSQIG